MHIQDIFREHSTTFSFEFFPPKTKKGFDKLFRTIQDLMPYEPSSVSVTYGAGGSTRERTHDLVVKIHEETNLTVIPHLTCVGAHRKQIYSILKRYADKGIENIFANEIHQKAKKILNRPKTDFRMPPIWLHLSKSIFRILALARLVFLKDTRIQPIACKRSNFLNKRWMQALTIS